MMNQIQNQAKVQVFVVCGICGCGKSTIAEKCSKYFSCAFIEGDDLHPIANKEMMRRGEPLDDVHRFPWLQQIAETIKLETEKSIDSSDSSRRRIFVTCSALKRIYREQIESNLPRENYSVVWVYLKIDDKEQLIERMRSRKGHFMNVNLVQSQIDALEEPNAKVESVIPVLVGHKSVEEIMKELIAAIEKF